MSLPVVARFLVRREVEHKTGLRRERIRQLEKLGQFPRRIALSSRKNVWLESEVVNWVAAKVADSRKEGA